MLKLMSTYNTDYCLSIEQVEDDINAREDLRKEIIVAALERSDLIYILQVPTDLLYLLAEHVIFEEEWTLISRWYNFIASGSYKLMIRNLTNELYHHNYFRDWHNNNSVLADIRFNQFIYPYRKKLYSKFIIQSLTYKDYAGNIDRTSFGHNVKRKLWCYKNSSEGYFIQHIDYLETTAGRKNFLVRLEQNIKEITLIMKLVRDLFSNGEEKRFRHHELNLFLQFLEKRSVNRNY